jgi:hypothetical protein
MPKAKPISTVMGPKSTGVIPLTRLPDITFLIFVTAISLFVLRNLSVYYVAIPPILAITAYISGRANYRSTSISKLYNIFLGMTFVTAAWSIIYNSDPRVLGQIPRLFVTTIIPLLVLRLSVPRASIEKALYLFIVAYIGAVFTYFYQINYGSIEWFNDQAMERGIVFRYATNLGSGNIYGIGLASALIFSWFQIKTKFYRATVIFLLLTGAILSIQKAALINIALGFFAILIIENYKNRLSIIAVIIVALAGFILITSAFPYSAMGIYTAEFLNNTFAIDILGDGSLRRDTVLDGDNISERLGGLHVQDIMSQHTPAVMFLIGVGITGAGGGLGLPEYLQAHSTFWDLFFVGGLPYLIVTIWLIAKTQIALWRKSDRTSNVFFWSNVVFVINMTSASAAIFHPILALPFWLSVAHCMISRGKMNNDGAPMPKKAVTWTWVQPVPKARTLKSTIPLKAY